MGSIKLSEMKGVSERDRKMLEEAEIMLGPEPSELGFIKNLFWGRFRGDVVFPYPEVDAAERKKCQDLLARLEDYLRNEHPAILIDQEEYIPQWCVDRFFELGVMGMTIPEEYGGLGLGVTSYNRVLELIGRFCASSAVMVSAHQSIGCKALMLFGTDEQKKRFLPGVAREYLSAFCLSEPQVGSDAAGQETRCEVSDDGTYFILNGEKKWSTSASESGILTVMCKQRLEDARTGSVKDGVTALICTPDMEGLEVFENNRSKTGIRGTWQGRIRFTNVRVPRENLLHREGKGLNVALTCLNYGRCTLSAGVTGGAKRAFEQATKWTQTRYQFNRPVADFELVQERIARMAAFTFAMDATLFAVTGMLDRKDSDIMLETAACKVFCSNIGWEVIDDAMQIIGGEAYMTENEFERLWRDNRIHRIVEGSNEVMQTFIFGYGGKQLAEQMVAVQQAFAWDPDQTVTENVDRILTTGRKGGLFSRALGLVAQLYFGIKPRAPEIKGLHPSLSSYGGRLSRLIQAHSHSFKLASKEHRGDIVKRQAVQARIADNGMYLFAMSASLSKMDALRRSGASGLEFERDRTAFEHAFDLLELRILENIRRVHVNADSSMLEAAEASRQHNDSLPNGDFYIHESSPIAAGTGKSVQARHIRQFAGSAAPALDGAPAGGTVDVSNGEAAAGT